MGSVDLIPAGAQHVKAAGIQVVGHHVRGDFHVLIGDDALGAGQEADHLAVGMGPLGRVEQAGNDVVAPRGRPPGEHDAQAQGLSRARLALRHDFHQLILAHEGQLLLGHLQHFQVKARQGAGEPGARRQARAQVRLVGPACSPKSRFVAKQCLDVGLPGFSCHHHPPSGFLIIPG